MFVHEFVLIVSWFCEFILGLLAKQTWQGEVQTQHH